MKKRIISVLCCIAMVFSLISVSVFAEREGDAALCYAAAYMAVQSPQEVSKGTICEFDLDQEMVKPDMTFAYWIGVFNTRGMTGGRSESIKIPSENFSVLITADSLFYPVFVNESGNEIVGSYGEWTLAMGRERCDQGDAYIRVDEVTGLAEYKWVTGTHDVTFLSVDENTHQCTCTKCSLHEVYDHWFTSEVTKKASLTASGERTYTCIDCGYSFTEELPRLTHSSHEYGDWEIVEEATPTNPGKRRHTCICGAEEEVWYLVSDWNSFSHGRYINVAARNYGSYTDGVEKHFHYTNADGMDQYVYISYRYGTTFDKYQAQTLALMFIDDGDASVAKPVYITRGSTRPTENNTAYGYDWAVFGYVRTMDQFIELLRAVPGDYSSYNSSRMLAYYDQFAQDFNAARIPTTVEDPLSGFVPDSEGVRTIGGCDVPYSYYVTSHYAYYVETENNVTFQCMDLGSDRFAAIDNIREIVSAETMAGMADEEKAKYLCRDDIDSILQTCHNNGIYAGYISTITAVAPENPSGYRLTVEGGSYQHPNHNYFYYESTSDELFANIQRVYRRVPDDSKKINGTFRVVADEDYYSYQVWDPIAEQWGECVINYSEYGSSNNCHLIASPDYNKIVVTPYDHFGGHQVFSHWELYNWQTEEWEFYSADEILSLNYFDCEADELDPHYRTYTDHQMTDAMRLRAVTKPAEADCTVRVIDGHTALYGSDGAGPMVSELKLYSDEYYLAPEIDESNIPVGMYFKGFLKQVNEEEPRLIEDMLTEYGYAGFGSPEPGVTTFTPVYEYRDLWVNAGGENALINGQYYYSESIRYNDTVTLTASPILPGSDGRTIGRGEREDEDDVTFYNVYFLGWFTWDYETCEEVLYSEEETITLTVTEDISLTARYLVGRMGDITSCFSVTAENGLLEYNGITVSALIVPDGQTINLIDTTGNVTEWVITETGDPENVIRTLPADSSDTRLTLDSEAWCPDDYTVTGPWDLTVTGVIPEEHTEHVDENGDRVCDVCRAEKHIVSLESLLVNTGAESVALLSGGGEYWPGEIVTVTASAKPGCTFNGWFFGRECIDPNLSFTFEMIDEDVCLTAQYESNQMVWVTVNAEGGTFTTVGSNMPQNYFSMQCAIGTELIFSAFEPDNISAWVNGSDKIVSTQGSVKLTVTSDTQLTLRYKTAVPEQAMVEFVSDYGQILAYQSYTVNDTIDFPDGPTKTGWNFTGWDMDETAIRDSIAGGETHITVKPLYTRKNIEYNVTVEFPDRIGSDVYTVAEGDTITIRAKEFEDKNFSCWKDSEGSVLSYDTSCFVRVMGDMVIVACYDEEVEARPVVTMAAPRAFVDGAKNKVAFTVNYDMPAAYSVIEVGIVRSTAVSEEDAIVIGSENVKRHISSLQSSKGNYTYNINVGSSVDTVIYARGYVTVKNDLTGNVETIYTDMVYGSFASVNND